MENYVFYTLEVKDASSDDFLPCKENDEIEKFDSFESAVYCSRYFATFNSECVMRVVRHVHSYRVECEISKFNESTKFEEYER